MRSIVKHLVLLTIIFLASIVSICAQTTIVRYDTICPGETGCHTYMDTLFYEDWEGASTSCWTFDNKGSEFTNGFSTEESSFCSVQDNTYCKPTYQNGKSLLELTNLLPNLYGYITSDEIVPPGKTAQWSDIMLSSFLSTAKSPNIPIVDPQQTSVSFYFYDELISYENIFFDYDGWIWDGSTDWYVVYSPMLNVLDQVALYASTRTSKIWGLDANAIDLENTNENDYGTWQRQEVSLAGASAGNTTLSFLHLNQGGIGFGVDNILVYGPRCIEIPAAVSALPAGSTYESTETVYRYGCTPTTIKTIWYVKGSPKDTVSVITADNPYIWNGDSYSTEGIHSKSGFKDIYDCDSTAYLDLKFKSIECPAEDSTETSYDTVCQGQTGTAGHGHTIPSTVTASESNKDLSTINNRETEQGCPIIETINWHINAATSYDTTLTKVNTYTWTEGTGETYTESGDYDYNDNGNLKNAAGCDSTVTLHLTIEHPKRVVLPTITTCDEYTWTDKGKTYTKTTTDSIVCKGCSTTGSDSTTVLTMVINKSYPNVINRISICKDSADMGGLIVDYDTTHQNLATKVGSCDSNVTTYITINPSYKTYDTIQTCNHDNMTISWRHTVLTEGLVNGGNYTLDTVTTRGCDSLFYLHLKLTNSVSAIVNESVVENDLPYTYNGQSYNKAVSNVSFTLQSVLGCDSLVTFNLYVYKNVSADIYETICYSQLPYTWNGKTFYASSLTDGMNQGGDIAQQTTLKTTHGADSAVIMHLHVNPIYDIHVYDTVCANKEYIFNQKTLTFNATDDKNYRTNDTLKTIHGCDSMVSLHLRIRPTYDHPIFDTAYSDQLPYFFGPYQCMEIDAYRYGEKSIYGCDSMLTLNLWIIQVTHLDTTVCSNRIPFEWHRHTFNKTQTDTITLTGIHGEDSLVLLHANIADTSAYYDVIERCDRHIWTNGVNYTTSTNTPYLRKTNRAGCDSVIHLDLTIHKSTAIADHMLACNSFTWINGITYESTIYGPQVMLHTVHGCDSLVTLDLYVTPSYYKEIHDSMCFEGQYRFGRRLLTEGGIYIDSLLTIERCDSIILLHLTELPPPSIETEIVRDCQNNRYHIEIHSEANYVEWSSNPIIQSLVGQEHNFSITINPLAEAKYTIYADYQPYPVCPATTTFSLAPLVNPTARLHTSPDLVTYEDNLIKAHDISGDYDTRNWYIDGLMQENHNEQYSFYPNLGNDSVTIMLEVISGFCRDTTSTTLLFSKPTLYLPTAFTPFLSTNNTFKPQGTGIVSYSMQIFNRHGLIVFSTRDFEESWDGKNNNIYCEQGTYVYYIRYSDVSAPESYKEITGSVLLIR